MERIYGIRDGSAGQSEPKLSGGDVLYQSDIAEMIGISVDTLNNYKKLTELVPELQDWVETGILAPTTAIVSNLQEKLKVLVTANFQRPKNSESNSMKKLLDTGEIIYCVEG